MTKYVILDAGGVICLPRMGDWLTPVRFSEVIGQERLSQVTEEALWDAKVRASDIYLDESLLLTDETLEFAARRNYFLDLAKRLNWTLTDREADVLARDMTQNDARYDFYDDTRAGLDMLGEHFHLALLSNAMPSLRRVFDNAGLLERFDEVVISCEIGAKKPDARMYQTMLERLEAKPEECVFVDDVKDNLIGAQACGIRGIHLCRDGVSDFIGGQAGDLCALARLLEGEEGNG